MKSVRYKDLDAEEQRLEKRKKDSDNLHEIISIDGSLITIKKLKNWCRR